jgi:hypothetical protein
MVGKSCFWSGHVDQPILENPKRAMTKNWRDEAEEHVEHISERTES